MSANNNGIKMENNDDNTNRTNLIINYLPQTLTDHEFKRIFEKIGPVVSAKIIRNRHTNYSYGFGFVEFHDPDNAQKAIDTLNGYQLGNKKIKVAFSRPHSDDIKRAKLYVKNIPSNLTVEQLNQWFGKFGTIIQSRLLEDNGQNGGNGQKNKGVAFILYDLHEQAEKAIENLNGVTMPGATLPLDIKFASTSGVKVGVHRGSSLQPQSSTLLLIRTLFLFSLISSTTTAHKRTFCDKAIGRTRIQT
jgi:ELAV like protein 2/3/4